MSEPSRSQRSMHTGDLSRLLPAQDRRLGINGPGPGVSVPELWDEMNKGFLRPPVPGSDLKEDVFR